MQHRHCDVCELMGCRNLLNMAEYRWLGLGEGEEGVGGGRTRGVIGVGRKAGVGGGMGSCAEELVSGVGPSRRLPRGPHYHHKLSHPQARGCRQEMQYDSLPLVPFTSLATSRGFASTSEFGLEI